MTTAVQEPVKKTAKIPPLAPWIAPSLGCPNKGCGAILLPKLADNPKGGEKELRYDCTNCRYSFYSSLIHANGSYKPLGEANKKLPEIFEKSTAV